MPGSQYIDVAEAAQYGLPNATSDELCAASVLIDSYLRRPEGLVWMPDSQQSPCYMKALNPTLSLQLSTALAPGLNVAATLDGPVALLNVGDVVILDKADASRAEACVVATLPNSNGSGVLTFQSVSNNHDIGASADVGLVVEEKKYMPDGRPITRASRYPLTRLLSGIGRYGYGRRGDGANYQMEQFNLLAALSKFGGPPVWELWQVPMSNLWDVQTGQIWVPAGVMLAYYSEVKFRYVTGYPQAGLPQAIKMACAKLVKATRAVPAMGNVKSFKAGDTAMTNFTSSMLDDDAKVSLRPYQVRGYA